jgi:hypothetical protein
MTYKTTQDSKDWIERTGSHATRPLLRVSYQPEIDLALVEAKRRRREWLARSNHPLREERVRKQQKKEFYRQRAEAEARAPAEAEAAQRLAMVMQQLGVEQ